MMKKANFDNLLQCRVLEDLDGSERLNQITLLLVQQNARLDNIENFLKSSDGQNNFDNKKPFEDSVTQENLTEREREIDNEPKDVSQMTPTERHIYETQERPVDYTNIDDVKKEIGKIKSGTPPSIPDEGFSDNSVKLEEIMPGREPEAYQAAYKSMEEAKKLDPSFGYSKSPKGGYNGSNAGF